MGVWQVKRDKPSDFQDYLNKNGSVNQMQYIGTWGEIHYLVFQHKQVLVEGENAYWKGENTMPPIITS